MAANTYTVSQYKNWTMTKLDDAAFNWGTLLQLLNDTNREICNSLPWSFMETTFVGTLTVNKNTYDLNATTPTIQQLLDFELTAPDASAIYVDYMPSPEFRQRYPNTSISAMTPHAPSVWTRFGNTLIFGPSAPDQTYTLTQHYLRVPTTLVNDTDTIDIPDDFSELVVLGMYARALELEDQVDYAATQRQIFTQQLGLMKTRYGQRQAGTPLQMQTRRSLLRGLPRGR